MNVNCPHCGAEVEIDPAYSKTYMQDCLSCGKEFKVQIGPEPTDSSEAPKAHQNQTKDPTPKPHPESKSTVIGAFIAGCIIGATATLFLGGNSGAGNNADGSGNTSKATGKFLRLPNGKEISLGTPDADVSQAMLDQVKLKDIRWERGASNNLRVDGVVFNDGPIDLGPEHRLDLHIYLLDRNENVIGKYSDAFVRDGLRAKESASFAAYCDYAGTLRDVHSKKLIVVKAGQDFTYEFE